MVKKVIKDLRYFVSNKVYCFILFLSAACAYGFKVTHVSVGIDDTAVSLYFDGGLYPLMGRWTLYLINKVFHISDFTPWMTDIVGVLLLILAALIWCVLLYSFLGEEVPFLGYAFFAALFVTCPLISEVYVYYLHAGISLGHVLCALSVFFVLNTLENRKSNRECCFGLTGASFVLLAALGCYESFVIVYGIGALLLFVIRRIERDNSLSQKYCFSVWRWGIFFLIPLAVAVLLRALVVSLICKIEHLSLPEDFIFGKYLGISSRAGGSFSEYAMYFKRFWVKFYLNGLVYLPIGVLVFSLMILLVYSIVWGIKRKDLLLLLAALTIPVLPMLLIFVEGKESYYRSCQYVPLVGAFGVLLLFRVGHAHLPIWGKRVGVLLAAALLWNQCFDMNRWFYVDYQKYEYFKGVMITVARDLERDYDLSKPVIFGGACQVPYAIMEGARIDFYSPQYQIIRALGDLVDPHLIEKYNYHGSGGSGYVFAETPTFSTLQWGVTAFDGTSREIQSFLRMLGYDIRIEKNLQLITDVEQLRSGMPHFPQNGYIQEEEDYIIVNF